MTAAPFPAGTIAALREETKVYLSIAGAGDDVLLDRMGAAALALGEALIGQSLIVREFEALLAASSSWLRLPIGPVRSIAGLAGVPAEGASFALAPDAYAIDIDATGDGWVRVTNQGAAGRIAVTFTAGLAVDWDGLPEPVRQGAVRLTAHLHQQREADDGVPPAAVTALWRPWRRIRLAEAVR